jgi:hypothetical protein
MEETLPGTLPRNARGYHNQKAVHFRELASTATTQRVKARLLQEAEQHERIARGEIVLPAMYE